MMNATPSSSTSFTRFMALAVLLWTSLPVRAFTSTLTAPNTQPLATTPDSSSSSLLSSSSSSSSSRLLYSNGDNVILPAAPTTTAVMTDSPSLAALPTIQSLDEWHQYFASAKQGITVVRFYSETCRACKQATPAFARLVASSNNKNKKLHFVQVPATAATKELWQHVGVTRMPWAQVYDHDTASTGNLLVHQGSVSRSKIASFRGALDKYLLWREEDEECSVDDDMTATCYNNYTPTFAMA